MKDLFYSLIRKIKSRMPVSSHSFYHFVEQANSLQQQTQNQLQQILQQNLQQNQNQVQQTQNQLQQMQQQTQNQLQQMQQQTQNQLQQIQQADEEHWCSLFQNDIRCRWQILDALEPLLYPPDYPAKCPICGYTAPHSAYEIRTTECIFGGGLLKRYVCPQCGCIFGPLKIMALKQSQLAEEYKQSYTVYRESDTKFLERKAFEGLTPRKDGIYLNYGAGAWNDTSEELRRDGWQVFDFEPYAPVSERPWLIRSFEELQGRQFDGIFSNDLIEHLSNPVVDLLAMKKLLKSHGRMAHGSGCYEYAYEYTRFHMFFLTGQSLKCLAERIGMTYELTDYLRKDLPTRVCIFTANKEDRA